MYKVYVQMPLALYDDQSAVVETSITVDDHYMPAQGQWFCHDVFKGLMPLGPVFYDGRRAAIVLTTRGTTYDFTVTLDEWLENRPEWYKAEQPFIEMGKLHSEQDEEDS